MDHCRLRSVILKLDNRLSNEDRQRFHFFLGDDVPRRVRDDATLHGTLAVIDCLFDQDKINERDFTYLIDAFEEIECFNAAHLLRGRTFTCYYQLCLSFLAKSINKNCSFKV